MRRHVMTGAVLAALLPAGAAVATTPPDTTPPGTTQPAAPSEPAPTEPGAVTETTAVDGAAPATTVTAQVPAVEPATIYDESRNAVATVTVTDTELAWTEYEERSAPGAGLEYVRMTVTVESLITGWHFVVAIDDFILQDNNGFVTTADDVLTAAQAEADEEMIEEADLAISGMVELALTFEVDPNVGPQSVFYRPDNSRLVEVAEVG